ncbi:hemerythrin domain-containing protein [Streptomyces oryzae]|uniref:Hemerythrin domain-containing protein n=1 Tax=Streptomyces oryzae TaxID=1434886 RepID=A0ABS3XCX2_9ACTN|nr:hemerythrin domain-containing protein [Streptomyces oryzae]MBO8193134.1 hemerythrin domain-containing protein [Streptomyces oryzae]
MPYRPDVLELLTDRHAEAERLVAAYEATHDPERRNALAGQLVTGLERHALAESQALHPVARRVLPDGERLVAAARRRWAVAQATARELAEADPRSPAAERATAALLDRLREHAARAEGELFSPLRGRLCGRERRELGATAARRLRDGTEAV